MDVFVGSFHFIWIYWLYTDRKTVTSVLILPARAGVTCLQDWDWPAGRAGCHVKTTGLHAFTRCIYTIYNQKEPS